ncbi:thioredoxin family protein [Budvicia diplopodorum]|uniref:thioredoxin family protein n=1 Tax=Budvicia diplopodorum TaxID=1119056 RepID=UPI00135AE531|nr:thioredoxin family protein [Budvicia diplopodorum]
MTTVATFYHAGCPVCISAEHGIVDLLDKNVKVDIVHLGERPDQIKAAEAAGVKSVPALVVNGQPMHINFGASLCDLK